jgi:hypothetical protein
MAFSFHQHPAPVGQKDLECFHGTQLMVV